MTTATVQRKKDPSELKNKDVVILCGGLGTRLQSVLTDRPKALAQINDTPFLEILLRSLINQGFRKFVLCVGHLQEQIINYRFKTTSKIHVLFSRENIPLGTGGALKNAQKFIASDPFFLLNGDSICQVDYEQLSSFHVSKKGLMTMVLTCPEGRSDAGNVAVNRIGRIINFAEKSNQQPECLINAGIYLMQQKIFSYMPEVNKFSLEYNLFPKIIDHGCFGYKTKNRVLDIGTPERLHKAAELLR